jgi:hypothetical protein
MNSYSQVPGCTDPIANNFNPLATINNGNCTYNNTPYTPALKVDPLIDTLAETSGLQWAGNALWTLNDGGGAAAIYKIDTITNALLQRVYLQGATNTDWEDIAFDGFYFYIADVGNNVTGARTDLKIYKFPLSIIPDHVTDPVVTIAADQVSVIRFTYSDQPQPPVSTGANNTQFDCEAMIVDNGKIHLFTKNWIDLTSTHYLVDSVLPGAYVANPVETLNCNYLVTAADKAVGNNVITLLGYQPTGTANHFMHLLSGYRGGKYFNGNKRRIDLPNVLVMGQAEGICFKNGYYGYISNERFTYSIGGFPFTISQKLRAFDIRDFVSGLKLTYIFSGNGNWSQASNWTDNKKPPMSLETNSQVIIDPLPAGTCFLDIPFSIPVSSSMFINPGKKLLVNGNLVLE